MPLALAVAGAALAQSTRRTAPGGGALLTGQFVDQVTPTGALDGVNATFALPSAPSAGSLYVWRNGLLMSPGVDYVLSGSSISFVSGAIPQPGDILRASYRR
jgi:hypothetical protein